MANLMLKVSESKYRVTLDQLAVKIAQMNEALARLQNQRCKIEKAYRGPQAEKAIRAIRTDEEQVKRAINMVTEQRMIIQRYLESMDRTATEIESGFEDAQQLANSVFN